MTSRAKDAADKYNDAFPPNNEHPPAIAGPPRDGSGAKTQIAIGTKTYDVSEVEEATAERTRLEA